MVPSEKIDVLTDQGREFVEVRFLTRDAIDSKTFYRTSSGGKVGVSFDCNAVEVLSP